MELTREDKLLISRVAACAMFAAACLYWIGALLFWKVALWTICLIIYLIGEVVKYAILGISALETYLDKK